MSLIPRVARKSTLFVHLACFGILGFSLLAGPSFAESAVISIDSGQVQGVTLDDTNGLQVFRGIPFAAPPVGDLRWKEPQPVDAWDGVRDCTEFGTICPQSSRLAEMTGEPFPETSEDCLYLNVYTTEAGSGEKLPVMVWIHGGGLTAGWSNQQIYDGSALADQGVVLVSINYRLGAFGYFSHPELSAESPNDSSGNYGFLDQVAALEWVQRNIGAFGGDANNVTIFGESAGGTSVYGLLVSPLSKGLFHRAIAESLWAVPSNFVPLRDAGGTIRSREQIGIEDAAKWAGDGETSIEALRALSAQELYTRSAEKYEPAIAIDGWAMTDFPERMFAEGKQHDVPVIAGTNKDEGTMFAMRIPYRTLDEYAEAMQGYYGSYAEDIFDFYPAKDRNEMRTSLVTQYGDVWFHRPTRAMLRGYDNVSSDVYRYFFTRTSPNYPFLGAHHAAEIMYAFNTLDPEKAKDGDYELASTMIGYWVQFAKTGNPNRDGLATWPTFTSSDESYLELGDTVAVKADLRKEACDLLDPIYAAYMTTASGIE